MSETIFNVSQSRLVFKGIKRKIAPLCCEGVTSHGSCARGVIEWVEFDSFELSANLTGARQLMCQSCRHF